MIVCCIETMKKPSRFMAKYVPIKANPLWIAAGICLLVAMSVFATVHFLVLLGIFLLLVIWSFLEKPKIDIYFENLYNSRRALSICDFAKEFNCREIDTWIVRAVYEEVQEYLATDKHLPLKSTDNLKTDLHLDDDDLDIDLAEQISQRTGRTMNNCEKNPYYGKVHTLRDLVLFFSHQDKNAT